MKCSLSGCYTFAKLLASSIQPAPAVITWGTTSPDQCQITACLLKVILESDAIALLLNTMSPNGREPIPGQAGFG